MKIGTHRVFELAEDEDILVVSHSSGGLSICNAERDGYTIRISEKQAEKLGEELLNAVSEMAGGKDAD